MTFASPRCDELGGGGACSSSTCTSPGIDALEAAGFTVVGLAQAGTDRPAQFTGWAATDVLPARRETLNRYRVVAWLTIWRARSMRDETSTLRKIDRRWKSTV